MRMTGALGGPTGCLCLLAATLSACGARATQHAPVIATIDGHELTRADLDESMQQQPQPTRAAVDALIDEQLLAQQALAEGLDGDPAVERAVQNARRHILAEAFATRLRFQQSPPTAAEIADYYRRNPALFGERRLYSLAVFTIDSAALSHELLATIGRTSSVRALGQLLTRRAIRFELQRREQSADELPMSQLARYSAAKVGDVLVADQGNSTTHLVQIAGIESRPTPFDSARPAIARYLAQRAQTTAIAASLARARSQARIIYYLQRDAPSRAKDAPGPRLRHSTIAQRVPNRDAAIAALN